MLRVIQGSERIAALTHSLRASLNEKASRRSMHRLGFQSGVMELPVLWFEEHEFFAAFKGFDNRSRNAFGLMDPTEHSSLSIVVELNFPWEGIDRRIGGGFLEDPIVGDALLGHRGNIGGGRKGIGKEAFFRHYPSDQCVEADDGGQTSKVALIGYAHPSGLLSVLRDFVVAVDRIKREITSGNPADEADRE